MVDALRGGRGGRPPARWTLPNGSKDAALTLQRSLNLHPLVAAVLVNRGLTDPAHAAEFLSPKLAALHDPFLMRDMDRAVGRIAAAIEARESILLYGDYDVDGTASIVVLKKA